MKVDTELNGSGTHLQIYSLTQTHYGRNRGPLLLPEHASLWREGLKAVRNACVIIHFLSELAQIEESASSIPNTTLHGHTTDIIVLCV